MPSLLLSVDEDETTPIGVFPNWRDAYAHAYFEAFDLDGNPGNLEPPAPEQVRAFEESFAEAFEPYERAPSEEGMDLKWDAGSWTGSYRIVHVPAFGRIE